MMHYTKYNVSAPEFKVFIHIYSSMFYSTSPYYMPVWSYFAVIFH